MDYLQWKTRTLDAETLYFYVTLSRLVYQHDPMLWKQLVNGVDGLQNSYEHQHVGLTRPGWTLLVGDTGSVLVVEGTYNAPFLWSQVASYNAVQRAPYPGEVLVMHAAIADAIWPAVEAELRAHATTPLTICGHSAGGSIGLLLAHKIQAAGIVPIEGVISFGANRTGNATFGQGTSFRVVRVTNEGDVVPQLPPPVQVNIGMIGSALNITSIKDWVHAGWYYHLYVDGTMQIGIQSATATAHNPPTGQIAATHPTFIFDSNHNAMEYARRLRWRLSGLVPLSMLQAYNLSTLDAVNFGLNADVGVHWGLNPSNGWLLGWEQDPNAPPPGPVKFASPDP